MTSDQHPDESLDMTQPLNKDEPMDSPNYSPDNSPVGATGPTPGPTPGTVSEPAHEAPETTVTTPIPPVDVHDAGGRHPVNVAHLVMGVAFVGLFLIWSVVQSEVFSGSDLRWLLPIPWLAAGAIGLVAVTRSRRASPVGH